MRFTSAALALALTFLVPVAAQATRSIHVDQSDQPLTNDPQLFNNNEELLFIGSDVDPNTNTPVEFDYNGDPVFSANPTLGEIAQISSFDEDNLTLSEKGGSFRSTSVGSVDSTTTYFLTFAFAASNYDTSSDYDFPTGPSKAAVAAAIAAAHPGAGTVWIVGYALGDDIDYSNGIVAIFTPGVAGGAPEPAIWIMMILGTWLVGCAVRRRHQSEDSITSLY